jgi:hypothetical protein
VGLPQPRQAFFLGSGALLVHNHGMFWTDAASQHLTPAKGDFRIACLVPSITELLFDLGLGERMVARTGFCIHPREQVRSVPKVGGTKDVNLERLKQLAPTHCIVNIDENTRETADALRAFVPNVIVTHPQCPADNLLLFDLIGGIFGREQAAAGLAAQLRARLHRIAQSQWPERRVLYLIWRDPWITVARDTYVSQMLALVNWHTLPDVQGGATGAMRYPQLSLSEPWLGRVQEVLLSSEPYRFDTAALRDVQALLSDVAPHARVRLIDGEMCSWYGSRAIPGLDYLAEYAIVTGN